MRRTAWGIAVVIAIVVSAWIYRDDPVIMLDKHVTPGEGATIDARQSRRQSAEAVLTIAPGMQGPRSAPQPSRLTPLMREFKLATSYKSLYDRIASATAKSPEEMWMLAQILERCGKNEDRKPPAPVTSSTKPGDRPMTNEGDEALRQFTASISDKDPSRAKRIAAFERMRADRCVGLREVKTSDAEIAGLRERAAAAGDAKARASILAREISTANKDRNSWATREISDAQATAVREVMASGDPDAIQAAAYLLFGYSNFSLRAGPDEMEVDLEVFGNAWTLVACDLGAICGPEGEHLASVCAQRGYCDASGVRDFLFYYSNSPYRSQLLARYYEGARAASNGDWSYFTTVRGPPPSQAMYTYRKADPGK